MTSKIEWTDETWNPITGCTPVSEGCINCYAKRMAYRLRGRFDYPQDEPFRVTFHPDKLDEPLKWIKPRRVFCCSMGDLLHKDVPFEHINKIFAIARLCSHHKFILLTKRPKRILEYYEYLDKYDKTERVLSEKQLINDAIENISGDLFPYAPIVSTAGWPLPNVWLGVSIANQKDADEWIPILLQIQAAVRIVSVEPMLGPVNFKEIWNEDENYCPSCGYMGPDTLDYYGCFHCELSGKIDEVLDKEGKCKSCGSWDHHIYCPKCGGRDDTVGFNGIDVQRLDTLPFPEIDGVICGCESGPGRRETKIEHVRNLRDQCVDAGVPFFLKQLEIDGKIVKMPKLDGKVWAELPK